MSETHIFEAVLHFASPQSSVQF